MSIKVITYVMRSSLRASVRHTAMVLAYYAADDGRRVFPSVARLARETGRSRRHIQRDLRELEHAGLLIADGERRGGATSTRYRFDIVGLTNAAAPSAAPPTPQPSVERRSELTAEPACDGNRAVLATLAGDLLADGMLPSHGDEDKCAAVLVREAAALGIATGHLQLGQICVIVGLARLRHVKGFRRAPQYARTGP